MSLPPEYRQYFAMYPFTDGSFAITHKPNTPPEAFQALERELKALFPDYEFNYRDMNTGGDTNANG